jgi:hypothetical protein
MARQVKIIYFFNEEIYLNRAGLHYGFWIQIALWKGSLTPMAFLNNARHLREGCRHAFLPVLNLGVWS